MKKPIDKLRKWLILKLGGYTVPVAPIQVECAVPIKGIAKALKFYADTDGFLNKLEEGLTSNLAEKLISEGRVAYHWARTSDPGGGKAQRVRVGFASGGYDAGLGGKA